MQSFDIFFNLTALTRLTFIWWYLNTNDKKTVLQLGMCKVENEILKEAKNALKWPFLV